MDLRLTSDFTSRFSALRIQFLCLKVRFSFQEIRLRGEEKKGEEGGGGVYISLHLLMRLVESSFALCCAILWLAEGEGAVVVAMSAVEVAEIFFIELTRGE